MLALIKFCHLLIAITLYGLCIESCYYRYMFIANSSGHIETTYKMTKRVVIADWLFTATGLPLANQRFSEQPISS